MKEYIVRSIFWTISAIIGLTIINIVEGETINWIIIFMGGLVFGVVDFLFSFVVDKIKRKE